MGLRRNVPGLVLALFVLAGAGAALAAGPAPGVFTRDVTSQDLAKAGSAAPHGTWTLRVKAHGMSLEARGQGLVPERAEWAGARVTVSDTPGAISLFCAPTVKGTYAWKRTGKMLAFTLVKDACKDRAGVLAGIWHTK